MSPFLRETVAHTRTINILECVLFESDTLSFSVMFFSIISATGDVNTLDDGWEITGRRARASNPSKYDFLFSIELMAFS